MKIHLIGKKLLILTNRYYMEGEKFILNNKEKKDHNEKNYLDIIKSYNLTIEDFKQFVMGFNESDIESNFFLKKDKERNLCWNYKNERPPHKNLAILCSEIKNKKEGGKSKLWYENYYGYGN